MDEVAKLVGMEVREYTGQDGRPRRFCGLHLVHLEGSVDGVRGCKVEAISCPPKVDHLLLEIGTTYMLKYMTYDTKQGKMARLVDLLPVEP